MKTNKTLIDPLSKGIFACLLALNQAEKLNIASRNILGALPEQNHFQYDINLSHIREAREELYSLMSDIINQDKINNINTA